jgi:hypothetical protein
MIDVGETRAKALIMTRFKSLLSIKFWSGRGRGWERRSAP